MCVCARYHMAPSPRAPPSTSPPPPPPLQPHVGLFPMSLDGTPLKAASGSQPSSGRSLQLHRLFSGACGVGGWMVCAGGRLAMHAAASTTAPPPPPHSPAADLFPSSPMKSLASQPSSVRSLLGAPSADFLNSLKVWVGAGVRVCVRSHAQTHARELVLSLHATSPRIGNHCPAPPSHTHTHPDDCCMMRSGWRSCLATPLPLKHGARRPAGAATGRAARREPPRARAPSSHPFPSLFDPRDGAATMHTGC